MKQITSNRVIQLFGFNPANRSEEHLKSKGIASSVCPSCDGSASAGDQRCPTCVGKGRLFSFTPKLATTW